MKKCFAGTLIILCFMNCMSHQDHDVSRPEIPHYVFNGTTWDMNFGTIRPNVPVSMSAVLLLYDVDYGQCIVTSDSNGYFEFDPIYPGAYFLSMQIDGYWVCQRRIEISHRDTTATLELPSLIPANIFSYLSGSSHPALACSGTNAWCNEFWWGTYPLNDVPPFIDTDLLRTYNLENHIWKYQNYNISPFYEKNLTAMTFWPNGLFACIGPDSLFALNKLDLTVAGKYKPPTNIRGIAFDITNNVLYSCSQNSIHKHNMNNPEIIEQSYTINTPSLAALAFHQNLYSYDNIDNYFYIHDQAMNIQRTCVLVDKSKTNMQQITNVYDMSFDGYGELWVTTK